MAAAAETSARKAEKATPPLVCSGNKDGPLSVNLSVPPSSLTKGHGGAGRCGQDGVVARTS